MERPALHRFNMRLWLFHRLYAELAWGYDAVSWMVSLGQWQEWRRAALTYVAGERVVEIGFGTGELLWELGSQGVAVCGIELSPQMHRVAAAKIRRRSLRTPPPAMPLQVRAAIQHLPFASGSVDTLVATFPAEYIGQARTWLELARVLKPPAPGEDVGGRCVVVGISVYVHRGPQHWLRRIPTRRRVRRPAKRRDIDSLTRCSRLAEVARLQTRIEVLEMRTALLPMLIAERVLP